MEYHMNYKAEETSKRASVLHNPEAFVLPNDTSYFKKSNDVFQDIVLVNSTENSLRRIVVPPDNLILTQCSIMVNLLCHFYTI